MTIPLAGSLILTLMTSLTGPAATTIVHDLELAPRVAAPHPVPWMPGPKTAADWAALIDATWGPGIPPAQQVDAFDLFRDDVDATFACFHDIDDVWLDLTAHYRPEVAGGVSRGRFAGILGRLSLSLRESHSRAWDIGVSATDPVRGVPLLCTDGLGFRAGQLGAAVTALDDGTGLVYRVAPNNPLGLQPGDVILGYDGRPWLDCLADLLAAELPITGLWGSSPSGWDHHWTAAVGANWHLFDTMDVLKYSTGETVHLSTLAVDGYNGHLYGSEQISVGIPFPNPTMDQVVTWGVIERGGREIGYIYVFGWTGTAGWYFHDAIDDLTRNHDTAGLIIDFRKNHGGNMFLSDEGLGLLFRDETPTIEWFTRCDPQEHLALCNESSWPDYVIPSDPPDRHYDRPIAVLTGPACVSSGDQVALRLTYHPMARVFGKTTAAAFNSPRSNGLGLNLISVVAVAECARLDALDIPLTHLEFPVDEPVWLEPDDVANSRDTVVEAAANWIIGVVRNEEPLPRDESEIPVAATSFLGARPNPFNPATELVFSLAKTARGELVVFDLAGRRVRSFALDGLDPGEHRVTWDGRSDAGVGQASGSYLIQLRTLERIDSGRVTLVR
ncbi:MAG: S41 family peptidase [bacterium]